MTDLQRRIAYCLIGMGILFGGWFVLGPRTQPATLNDGLNCVSEGDSEGVDRIERSLLKARRVDEAILLRCSWLARRGRHEEVLKRLPHHLIDGPFRRQALRLIGNALFQAGDFIQSEAALSQMIAEYPDEVEAYRLLAVMYYDQGAATRALSALSQVERLAPEDYRPFHMAGLILTDNENFPQANNQFRQALQNNPPEHVEDAIRIELAKSLIRVREYQEAIEVLEALRRSEDSAALLAECYWSLGQKDQATQFINKTLSANPDHLPSLRIKARLMEDQGQLDEAIEILKKVVQIEPFDVERRYNLVQLLGAQGLISERDQQQLAYQEYRALQDRLVELNSKANESPDSAEIRSELADVCRKLGRTALANMWQRAAELCQRRELRFSSPGPAKIPDNDPDNK